MGFILQHDRNLTQKCVCVSARVWKQAASWSCDAIASLLLLFICVLRSKAIHIDLQSSVCPTSQIDYNVTYKTKSKIFKEKEEWILSRGVTKIQVAQDKITGKEKNRFNKLIYSI